MDNVQQNIKSTTTSDGVSIRYATSGQGPPLVVAAGWLNHLDHDLRSPVWRHWWEELSKDHLLVRYDGRGCGLCDWSVENLSLDAWVGDLDSVINALALDRFALLGISLGGSVAIEYAARDPKRVSHLVLYGASARGWAHQGEELSEAEEALTSLTKTGWGQDNPEYQQAFASTFMPGANPDQLQWFYELQQVATSPENAARIRTEWEKLDISYHLSQVSVPTLVLHSRSDAAVPFEEGCRVAALIPGARFVPLESKNHFLLGNQPAWPALLSEVRYFLSAEADRASALEGVAARVDLEGLDLRSHIAPDGTVTLLFSDIEDSTVMTERLGDRRMQEVLRAHNSIVRQQVEACGGFEVKSMGDGFMLAFSSARRALQCATAMTEPPLVGMLKGTVEADETYIGGRAANMHKSKRAKLTGRGTADKPPIFALVERDGQLRGQVVASATGDNLKGIIRQQVAPEAVIMTDEHGAYHGLSQDFAGHEAVTHSQGEYVRGDAHTNTLEGAFSLFKRQIVGAHHHVSPEH